MEQYCGLPSVLYQKGYIFVYISLEKESSEHVHKSWGLLWSWVLLTEYCRKQNDGNMLSYNLINIMICLFSAWSLPDTRLEDVIMSQTGIFLGRFHWQMTNECSIVCTSEWDTHWSGFQTALKDAADSPWHRAQTWWYQAGYCVVCSPSMEMKYWKMNYNFWKALSRFSFKL